MAQRHFSKVSPTLWTSRRFRSVGFVARTAFLYLITNAHINSSGCYRLPSEYACADTGMDYSTWRAAFAELVAAEMVEQDTATDYVIINKWFEHNPLTNLDHAKGTARRIATIDSDNLREKCEAAYADALAELECRIEESDAAKRERAAKTRLAVVDASNALSGNRLTGTGYMQGRKA